MTEQDMSDRANEIFDADGAAADPVESDTHLQLDRALRAHADAAADARPPLAGVVVWPAVNSRGSSLRLVRNPLRFSK